MFPIIIFIILMFMSIQMAVLSKAMICDRSFPAIADSNPTGVMDVCLL